MSKSGIDRRRDESCDPAWQAIAKVVGQSYQALLAAAAPFASPGTCSHDIVQGALITAHDCFSNLKDKKKLFSWLRTIVVNEGREVARKRARRWEKLLCWAREQAPAHTGKYSSIRDELVRLALERAVENLPQLQRKVIKLRVFEDMTIKEIAGEIGRAPGTVKASLFRARVALRDELEAE